jgi:hypothetical protein
MAWLWLVSPFVLIALIARDPVLRAGVAQHHRRCQVAGWSGAVAMCLGVAVVPGLLGTLLFLVGTPLCGLAVWLRGEDDDDDDDGGDPPPIDWGEFEGAFWGYVRSRGRRPRTPTAR